MKLFWFEFLKIARIPMIWIYFFGCFFYNYSELTSGIAYYIDYDYLEYTNTIVKEIGWELGQDFDNSLENMPDHPYKARLQAETQGLGNYFDNMDIDKLSEIMIDFSNTRKINNTFFTDKLKANFEKLGEKVNNIEAVSLLAGSQSQWIYNLLFNQLFPSIIMQVSILAVIIMIFLTDYEEIEKTYLLIYSTKIGRKIQRMKIISGCLITLIFFLMLYLMTFTAFFFKFDLSGIFYATMDSPFLSISIHMVSFPFITWHSFTFIEYFLWISLLSVVFVLIYTGMSWVIALFCQNMYLAFGLCFVGVLSQFFIYFHCLNKQFILGRYLMELNPLILSLRLNTWLTYMGYSAIIPYQETWGIISFFVVSFFIICATYRLFTRKDIL